MNRTYDEIMEMIGGDEFKELIKKWDALSSNISNTPQALPRLLPNLLWVGNSGIGRTKLMRLMSSYLASKGNLLDFYGDVKYFEFLLSYVPKDAPFQELQRLEDELAAAKGFRNEFRGAVLIDIDPWVDHYEELYFTGFMEYLAAHSDKWMIVLSISEIPAEKLQNLEAFLAMYLRLDKIMLPLPETEDLFTFVARKLSTYNLSLDQSARELLVQTINELRENLYFDGFKTITMLCQDIVYEHFSSSNAACTSLSAADLAAFAPGSNYVKKVIKNSRNRIGFTPEEV
jgi:hypothetical protein